MIKVVYWSQTGNTKQMALAVCEGVKEAGKEATALEFSEITVEELKADDTFVLGCPAMGAEELDDTEVEPFVAALEPYVSGKKIGLFGSYGWGDGQWMRDWVDRMKAAGAIVVGEEGVICCEAPDDAAIEACKNLGKALV